MVLGCSRCGEDKDESQFSPQPSNADEWLARLDEFQHACAYCLRPRRMTMDHMTPLSRGGRHELDNIVPACGPCNSRKNTKTHLEFLAVL